MTVRRVKTACPAKADPILSAIAEHKAALSAYDKDMKARKSLEAKVGENTVAIFWYQLPFGDGIRTVHTERDITRILSQPFEDARIVADRLDAADALDKISEAENLAITKAKQDFRAAQVQYEQRVESSGLKAARKCTAAAAGAEVKALRRLYRTRARTAQGLAALSAYVNNILQSENSHADLYTDKLLSGIAESAKGLAGIAPKARRKPAKRAATRLRHAA
jgi:hypothetical protein